MTASTAARPADPAAAARPAWPGPRARWGWMLFDWAGQPCATLILTFVFAPYFAAAVAPDPETGQAMWGWATAASGLAVALLSPALGAMSDAAGPRKPWIAVFSLLYMLGAAMLWFALPADPAPWRVLFWAALAFAAMEFAAVFTNAMLPGLAPPEALGRLSGSGWALGYVGGVVSLAIMLGVFAESGTSGLTMLGAPPALGLDAAAREGTRIVGPFSAFWYAVFVLPLFLWTPDAARRAAGMRQALGQGMAQLAASLRDLKGRRSLARFLIASMLYRDALMGFYAFGGIYAVGVLHWSVTQVGIFGVVAAVLGALGAWLGGIADGRFGPRPVVEVSLAALVIAALVGISVRPGMILFVIPVGATSAAPDLVFTAVGGLIGAFGGALQAASRTLLARLADPERMTASFGLYALSGKATAFVAPAAIAIATQTSGDQQTGVAPVIALFAIGFALLRGVEGGRG